ncbi:MAG: hypothetical protein GC152_04850 [Alphaproteobacteria bacterium]|nr:hypothetical protein [Alphaproteobacteria bacterium]
MLSSHAIFEFLIAGHIITGAPGLLGFWGPVATKKGGARHRMLGRFFAVAMLITGGFAIAMATMTMLAPMATHPHLVDHPAFSDPILVRGIFGVMMLHLALLTINLAWYGWLCPRNKLDHSRNVGPVNIFLQAALLIAAGACLIEGVRIDQPIMIGISTIGFATVTTNAAFLLKSSPGPADWLLEHIKAGVGAGISVYTAFFAFGAVRLVPELALAPILWATPLTIGLGLILYHQRSVRLRFKGTAQSPFASPAP